jgi:hypothetical protein
VYKSTIIQQCECGRKLVGLGNTACGNCEDMDVIDHVQATSAYERMSGVVLNTLFVTSVALFVAIISVSL